MWIKEKYLESYKNALWSKLILEVTQEFLADWSESILEVSEWHVAMATIINIYRADTIIGIVYLHLVLWYWITK